MSLSANFNRLDAGATRPGNVMRCFFLATVFLAIFSPTAVYLSAFSIGLLLFSQKMRAQLPELLKMVPVRIGLLYLLAVLVGVLYTPAVSHDITKELMVVVLFTVLLPLWLPAFRHPAWQERVLLTLLASVVFLSLVMIANFYHLISWQWQHQIFLFRLHYLQQEATLIALGIYVALHVGMNQRTRLAKVSYIMIAFFLVVVALIFQHERVGMVLSLVSLLLFCAQHLRCWKWLLVILVGFGLIFSAAYHFSSPSRHKIDRLIHSGQTLRTNHGTSLAIRWYTAQAALQVAGEKSTFGFGTGVFSPSKKSMPVLSNQPKALELLSRYKPEVGSIFVLLRHGWLGFFIFAGFLFSWWWASRSLSFHQSSLVFSTLAILTLADCSYPAYYHSRAWVWLFAILVATMGSYFSQPGHSAHEDTDQQNG